MVRFVCLKMHSGRSVGKGFEAEKLAAGRLAPQVLHACAEEREGERCAGIPCLLSVLLKESWAFSFHLPVRLLFGGRLRAGLFAAASKTQNPRASRIPQSPPGEQEHVGHPDLLKHLLRGCAREVISVLCMVAWPSAGLSCSVLLPNPFVPPLQTFNFGDQLFLGARPWGLRFSFWFQSRGKHPQIYALGQELRRGSPCSPFLAPTGREDAPAHACDAPENLPFLSHSSCSMTPHSLCCSLGSWETNSPWSSPSCSPPWDSIFPELVS